MEGNDSQQPTTIPIQPSDIPKGSASRQRKPYRAGIIIVVLVLCGVSFLGGVYGSGLLSFGLGSQKASAVCDSSDIQVYNKFVTQFTLTDAQQKDKATKMQEQIDALKKKENFTKDPSCVFREYSAAVVGNNPQSAETAYTTLKTLSDQGRYPSNEVLDVASLSSMHDRIEALKNAGKGNSDPKGSG